MPTPGPDWSVSPEHWGARVDYDEWGNDYQPNDGVVLHHGGGGNYRAHLQPYSVAEEMKQLRAWEAFHIDGRGWRGIAYGWAVGQSGNVYRLRGWNRPGAHTGDMDSDGVLNNDDLAAILFIGSGNYVALSSDAQDSLARLRAYINETCSQNFPLYGHREASGNTSCPGPKLMDYVNTHRLLEEDMPLTAEDLAQIRAIIREEIDSRSGGAVWASYPHYTIDGKDPNTVLRQIRDSVEAIKASPAGGASAEEIVAALAQELAD